MDSGVSIMSNALVLESAVARPSSESKSVTMGRRSFALPHFTGIIAISAQHSAEKTKQRTTQTSKEPHLALFLDVYLVKSIKDVASTRLCALSPS